MKFFKNVFVIALLITLLLILHTAEGNSTPAKFVWTFDGAPHVLVIGGTR